MSKSKSQYSFFDLEIQLDKIHQVNDFWPRLNALVDWELFRPTLNKVREKDRLSNAGRPPMDVVLMFKCLVIKTMYNLSDEQTEVQIRDRISLRDFLGLSFADTIPDTNTIWDFANDLKKLELEHVLFDQFWGILNKHGYEAKSGLMSDATFVEVPRQRNSKEENAQIKAGEVPERIAENPHVLAQKDLDAEWAKKGDENHFGYKNHVTAEEEHKFIAHYAVTGAATHDSEPYLDIVPETARYPGQEVFADSAYVGEKTDTELKKRGFLPFICEKGYRNKPLTEEQKLMNREKSRIRCRVEHIFGEQKMRMGDETLRSIGFSAARFWIGLRNLAYNMSRLVSLKRPKPVKAG
jgi:IS5 family transposase